MTRNDRETLARVIADWRKGKSTINEEMLKTAVKPIVDVEVGRYADQGVRKDDLEKEAFGIIFSALQDYTPDVRDLAGFLSTKLLGLREKVGQLRLQIEKMRNSGSPQGIRT